MPIWFAGGSGGGVTAIGLYSGAGYPNVPGAAPGDLYRQTDGGPGRKLWKYAGAFTGMPRVINVAYTATNAAGTPTLTFERNLTPGTTLLALGAGNGSIGMALQGGWTSIFANGAPPTMCPIAGWQANAGGGNTAAPFTVSGTSNVAIVLEIDGANAAPVAGSANGTPASYSLAGAGNLLVAMTGGTQQGGMKPPGPEAIFCARLNTFASYQIEISAVGIASQLMHVDPVIATPTNVQATAYVEVAAGSGSKQYWSTVGVAA